MDTVDAARLDVLLLAMMLADGEVDAASHLIEQAGPFRLTLGFVSILHTLLAPVAAEQGHGPRVVLERMLAQQLDVELAAHPS